MNERELQILISMRDEFSKKLTDIENSLNKTTTEVKGADNNFKKLAKTIGGVATVYASLRFAMSSIKEFAQFEETQFRLAKIINNATGATREQIQTLFDQADALEKLGVVDKVTIMDAQAKLATFDLQTDSIKKLTPALLDMAVAEYGVSVSSEQIVNLSQGLGKALQGNTELLVKQGFVISDVQREMLKTGTETERLATLNEILGRTYDGVNQEATKTVEGALKDFDKTIGDIKENIGKALTPTLMMLMGDFDDLTKSALNSAVGFEKFAEVIYRTVGFVKTMWSGTKTWVLGVTAGIDVSITSLVDSITGKNNADALAQGWKEVLTESGQEVKNNFDIWFGAEGFKMPEFNLFGSRNKSELVGDLGDLTSEVREELDSLTKEYKSFSRNVDDTLYELSETHENNINKLTADITKLQQELVNTTKSFSQDKEKDDMSIAESFVNNQERINEIQNELQNELSHNRRKTLEDELMDRQAVELENAELIASIQDEMAEIKRQNALTDIEREVEDYYARREIAENEYNETVARLNAEISAVQNKIYQEQQLYSQKREFIIAQQLEASKEITKILNDNVNATKEAISKEIEYYKELARVIAEARGASSSGLNRIQNFQSVNDAIISPKGDIITTHPDDYLIATKNPSSLGGGGGVVVNVYGDVSGDELIDKVSQALMKNLRSDLKFSI